MTPSEIEKCPGHPLNTPMYLATLDEIYKVKDPDAQISEWEGSVAEHIEWTVSDGAEEVANGLMDVFPRAVHTNCNVHHLVKGFGQGGGLRKALKEDHSLEDQGDDEEEEEEEDETSTERRARSTRKRKRHNDRFEQLVQVFQWGMMFLTLCTTHTPHQQLVVST
jgi:hypothetical protein